LHMRRGVTLLLVLMLSVLGWRFGWELPHRGGPPAFCLPRTEGVPVMLGAGFPGRGLHQFSDGTRPSGVISMTFPQSAKMRMENISNDRLLKPGECLEIRESEGKTYEVKRHFLPATERMTLGIPLRVETMKGTDWEALPGVGPKLSARIEENRQLNGGFRSLEGLKRVPGIGKGRLRAWRKFFIRNY
jgi:competence protein ComEA